MAYDFNSLTKQAPEASNRDGFYTDFEDVDPSKLHQISELTEWMRTKAKGSDVREVIAQLFERTWVESIKEGNANLEVAQARGSYPNLKSRLDNVDNKQQKTTEQLAQKANKDEVTNVMTPKGTSAYASLPTSGNQVGWYYYCPDGDGVHGAGNYVWNGKSWFFGGTGDEGYNLLKKDIDDYKDDYNARLYNTKLITKQLSDFDFYANGWMTNSGNISTNGAISHKVVTFKKAGIKKIYANYAEYPANTINVITIKDYNGNVVYYNNIDTSSKEYAFDISNLDDDCIVYFNYFNYNSDTYTHELTFEYTIPKSFSNAISKIKTGYDILNIPFNDVYGKTVTFKFDNIEDLLGFVGGGTYSPHVGRHKHVIFESRSVKSITVNTNTEANYPFAFLYDTNKENGSPIIGQSGGTYTFAKPRDGYIGVNHFLDGDYNHEFTVEFFDEKTVKGYITELPELTELKYKHLVRKPLTFNAKTCTFTGDSITYGFTSGSSNVHNTGDYPTLFCNKVGATKTNLAAGGALFCSGYNTVKTIPEQVSEANKECDFLFIAGGINDWQSGQTLSDLETVLDNLCTYINETFSQSTQVIWITPINQAGWETTHNISPTATVQEFRNLITRTVLKNDIYSRFSIVQGNEFNFPDKNDDKSYITAMFGDLLHPSELGYKTLYLTGLLNALC